MNNAGNGDKWKEQRTFSLKVMRHLGLGKQEIEDHLMNEIDELIAWINDQGEQPLDLHHMLGSSITSFITKLSTGEKFEKGHHIRKLIEDCFLTRGKIPRPTGFGMFGMMPAVAKFLMSLPGNPGKEYHVNIRKVESFLEQRMDQLKKSFNPDSDNVDCFMKAYIKKMADTKKGKFFSDENLIGCTFAFVIGGSETSGDAVAWFMLYLMLHPDVQERMRQEIDDVIGDKRITLKYRYDLPYTQAALQELHRIVSVFPTGVPHAVAEDVSIKNWHLQKGTHVILDIHAVHRSSKYFQDPNRFDPSRFLDGDGKFVYDERVITFGYGKRSCPGQPIAEAEIFLYIVSFLQRFRITCPEGVKYTTESVMELIGHVPKHFPIKAIFKRRERK